ncbi:MAG: hypothetical protein ACD_8C00113G0006 [uncultured bacterium]|nr:MAG: hypothetical protein ACD_8C00113G0006 [uncultured bacterium]
MKEYIEKRKLINIPKREEVAPPFRVEDISLEDRSAETREAFVLVAEAKRDIEEKWDSYIHHEAQFENIEEQQKCLDDFINARDKHAFIISESIKKIHGGDIGVEKEKNELQEKLNEIRNFQRESADTFYPEAEIEEEQADKTMQRTDLIRPQTSEDRVVIMRNYESNIRSLGVEISALEMLATEILSNPDSLQISLYDAKSKDIAEQIESLDQIYKDDGFDDLNKELEQVKSRFEELAIINTEKLRENLG